jgi:type VI secretion system protein ImpF
MALNDRYQIPLMYCFEEAFRKKDSRIGSDGLGSSEQGRILNQRSMLRRKGMDDGDLRRCVEEDLSHLMSAIDLQSAVDLDGLEHVSRSILNYGLYDIAHLTSEDKEVMKLDDNVIAAIMSYEPRIKAESVIVQRAVSVDDTEQKVRLSISAEISSQPLDIPIEFVAELDVGAGKVNISKSTLQ